MRIKLAILDNDQSYLNRIVVAFNNKFADKLEIYSFTNQEAVLNSIEASKMDVLIASDFFAIECKKLPKRCAFAYFVDSADIETIRDQRTICKFQKAELIYKEILSLFSENASDVTGLKMTDSSTRVATFMSPSGGVGASSVAVACAKYFAKKGKKTLFISLDMLGRTDNYFEADGQFDFGDVLYAIKSKKSNLTLKLESIVKQDQSGVFFYASTKSALDMMEMTKDEFKYFLSEVKAFGSYDVIIIDNIFSLNDRTIDIMKSSHSIVLVSDGSEVSNDKFDRAYAALHTLDSQKELSLMDRVSVLYNKFSNKTGKSVSVDHINVIGGAPKFEQATSGQVVELLAGMPMFSKLFEL